MTSISISTIKENMGYVDNPSSPRCSSCRHVECVDHMEGKYVCKANPAISFSVKALGTCNYHEQK